MKRVKDKIIEETLRLDQCSAGDYISGPYRSGISDTELVMIKPLTKKGLVQIKYRRVYRGSKTKVHKLDIPGDTEVVRRRKATRADGPDAGQVQPETFCHDGILYERNPIVVPSDNYKPESRHVEGEILPPLPPVKEGDMSSHDTGSLRLSDDEISDRIIYMFEISRQVWDKYAIRQPGLTKLIR